MAMTKEDFDRIKKESDKAFVDKIIETIEKGIPSWRKPWTSDDLNQYNPITNTVYKGINFLRLYFEAIEKGYTDNRWLTMNNIKEKKYHLNKGSSGVPIYKYIIIDKITKKEPDFEEIKKMPKEEQKNYINQNIIARMTYCGSVFNANCIEGIEKKKKAELTAEEIEKRKNEEIESIEKIIKNSAAPILYDSNQAFYNTVSDSIHLPKRNCFLSNEGFYSTALHEMAHSTGHSSRMNRDLSGAFGSESYAKEELKAELTALFLSMELNYRIGIPDYCNSAAYLKSWVEILKKDYNEFYKASGEAQKISLYIKDNYLNAKDNYNLESISPLEQMRAAVLEIKDRKPRPDVCIEKAKILEK